MCHSLRIGGPALVGLVTVGALERVQRDAGPSCAPFQSSGAVNSAKNVACLLASAVDSDKNLANFWLLAQYQPIR
jgi:hypothetical protein